MAFPIGAALGAAASLAGSFMSSRGVRDANSTNARIAEQNIQLQREFAQNGIRWKVADAQKAGVHPLFALGANTTSFSPVSVGTLADTNIGEGIAEAGQNLGRAIDATRTNKDKAAVRINELTVERGELENQLLREQIRNMRAQTGPALPDLLSAASSGQEGKSYGWHMDKRGIAKGFLEPVGVDEEGNRLIHMGGGNVMRLRPDMTPAEVSEELLGEIGSLGDQAAKAGTSFWDYILRGIEDYGDHPHDEDWSWSNNPLLRIRKVPERR